jgi:hypothetical protein
LRNEKCSGESFAKKVSIFLCDFMTAEMREKLLVVRNTDESLCFNNVVYNNKRF